MLPVALIEVIPQATHLLIENIAVLPNQQGKGLGDLLLNHAETSRAHFISTNCSSIQMRPSSRTSNSMPVAAFRNSSVSPSLQAALRFT